MKNTVFPHKFWRPFLDCMPQLFFRPQYVWFPVHLKGHLIPLCYETLVVNWQNWLFTSFYQSRSVLSPNPINNIPVLVQILAWRRPGDKPLSGPMMVRLPTHICVTRPQWVNHRHAVLFCRNNDSKCVFVFHYSDVIWASWYLKSSATWLFVQVILAYNKEIIKAQSSALLAFCEHQATAKGIH